VYIVICTSDASGLYTFFSVLKGIYWDDDVARQVELVELCADVVYLMNISWQNGGVAGQWGPCERCTIFRICLNLFCRRQKKEYVSVGLSWGGLHAVPQAKRMLEVP